MSVAGYNGPQLNYAYSFKSLVGKPGLLTLSLVTPSTGTGIQGENHFGSLSLSFYIWTWRNW